MKFINSCPDNEIDSLKNYMTYFIKVSDDIMNDGINALKDSGELDSNRLFKNSTITEIKILCIQSGWDYSRFTKDIYQTILNEQQIRNNIKNSDSPLKVTDSLRTIVIKWQKRCDSIRQNLYYRMFVSYK
ncbi:MAG TPA: hypothetical protein VK808_06380 [Bacteroidia bacterium]|nr:hypothetical protein [Bacteroidia bacterium]